MSDQAPLLKRIITRRTFGKVGVTGLAAAAAVVGTGGRAEALVPYFCCNLVYKPTWPYSGCSTNASYIWGCYSGAEFCRCCENYPKKKSSVRCGN